ncbi:MAG: glycosyltransferase family 4 protein [Desulfuromonadaceae bacterium]
MRILMLTQWFDPEPTFKGLAFARELVRLGHNVEVLTGFPNYPGGKLYPGYKVRLLQRETIDGVSVIRVPLYTSHNDSALKRIANYVSFAFSAALLGPFLIKQADVVYVYHPPATVALPAMMIKLLRGIPFVYDIQDLWPDTLAASGMLNNRNILKCVEWWCRLTYRIADHIVVLSPGFKRKLIERGIQDEKISVIYNWCDEGQISILERCLAEEFEPDMVGRFNIVFAGTMGKAQALDAVLDAAKLLAVRLPLVQFVFIGSGIDVERLKQIKSDNNLANVIFLPRRPFSEIGSVLSMADLLLVHLKDDPLFEITLPSKTQAYMAAGRPILMAVRGDAVDLIETAGAGVACIPENANSIASTVEKMASLTQVERDEMGKRGARFYQQELSLAIGARRFENLFNNVVHSK